jgi:hypothetical protein
MDLSTIISLGNIRVMHVIPIKILTINYCKYQIFIVLVCTSRFLVVNFISNNINAPLYQPMCKYCMFVYRPYLLIGYFCIVCVENCQTYWFVHVCFLFDISSVYRSINKNYLTRYGNLHEWPYLSFFDLRLLIALIWYLQTCLSVHARFDYTCLL